MDWILPANVNIYNHRESFKKFGAIDWKQSAKYEVGDRIFIYATKPLQQIKYVCEVVEVNIPRNEAIVDKEFWVNEEDYDELSDKKFAKLILLKEFPDDFEPLIFSSLQEKGLKGTIQGVRRLENKGEILNLYNHIMHYANMPQIEISEISEIMNSDVTSVVVEGERKKYYTYKYERNSKLRDKAIEIHGCDCKACGFDFEKKYGALGEGYIEVHHVKPLYLIEEPVEVNPVTDLIPLCANCHRMMHRSKNKIMILDELKGILKDNEPNN